MHCKHTYDVCWCVQAVLAGYEAQVLPLTVTSSAGAVVVLNFTLNEIYGSSTPAALSNACSLMQLQTGVAAMAVLVIARLSIVSL